MARFAKFSAAILFVLTLAFSFSGIGLAASGSRVSDDGRLFTDAAKTRIQQFADAMKVPVVVITSSSFGGSKTEFTDQVSGNVPSNGVLIATNSREGSRFYVVLHGRSSGLSNSDDQRAYDAGTQYLRASGGPNYAAAVFASLYSFDGALGGQASDAIGIAGSPGSGFVASSGSNPPVSSGNTSSGTSNPPTTAQSGGSFFDSIGSLFGNVLCCLAIVVIVIILIVFSLFSSGKRAVQRKDNYGGYSGYGGNSGNSGGGLGGLFGGNSGNSGGNSGGGLGGFFGGNSGNSGNSGGNSGGYRRGSNTQPSDPTATSFGGTTDTETPKNAGGGTYESPFANNSGSTNTASSGGPINVHLGDSNSNRPTRQDGDAFLGDVFDNRNNRPQDSSDNRGTRKQSDEDF